MHKWLPNLVAKFWLPNLVLYQTVHDEVNSSLFKPPLTFNGGFNWIWVNNLLSRNFIKWKKSQLLLKFTNIDHKNAQHTEFKILKQQKKQNPLETVDQ